MKILRNNSDVSAKALGYLTVSVVTAVALSACKTEPKYPGTHYFEPSGGAYPTAQVVDIQIPSDATNVFITTDSIEPWPSEYCVQGTGKTSVNISQPTAIKIRYDQYGETITDEAYYFIEDSATDGGHLNRDLLNIWESFFASHVLNAFTVPDQDHSLLTRNDGQGGTMTLETNITDRGWIFDDPEEANQTYSFNNYHYTDRVTGVSFVIESGAVYGYRNESRGFFNSEPNGSTIIYSGDINGWAEGSFIMNGDGQVTSGYYRIFCSDAECANNEVIYGLNTTANEYIEVSPMRTEDTLSCSPNL